MIDVISQTRTKRIQLFMLPSKFEMRGLAFASHFKLLVLAKSSGGFLVYCLDYLRNRIVHCLPLNMKEAAISCFHDRLFIVSQTAIHIHDLETFHQIKIIPLPDGYEFKKESLLTQGHSLVFSAQRVDSPPELFSLKSKTKPQVSGNYQSAYIDLLNSTRQNKCLLLGDKLMDLVDSSRHDLSSRLTCAQKLLVVEFDRSVPVSKGPKVEFSHLKYL
jgi:hypothetical protein